MIKQSHFTISFFVPFLVSIGVLSELSPQVRYLLGPFIPIAAVLLLVVVILTFKNINVLFKVIKKYKFVFILGLIFVVQSIFRLNEVSNDIVILSNFIIYPIFILILIFLVAIVVELGQEALENFKKIVIVVWTLSLILGIPTLLKYPMVARLITSSGNSLTNEYYKYCALGVGSFSTYTAYAISLPLIWSAIPIFSKKIILLIKTLVFFSCISVFLSAFTFASIIVIFNFTSIFLNEIINTKLENRFRKMLTPLSIIIIVLVLPFTFDFDQYEATRFTMSKFDNALFKYFSNDNIFMSDDTSRLYWVSEELVKFIESPIIGFIPTKINSNIPIYFHSSFSNFLVLFGLPFALVWFCVVFYYFKINIKNIGKPEIFLYYSALLCFIIAGIINPVWNNPTIFISLIIFSSYLNTSKIVIKKKQFN
ncbi:MAG: hypothetical protein WAR79_08665 [Melioribacteraceae bacterium]